MVNNLGICNNCGAFLDSQACPNCETANSVRTFNIYDENVKWAVRYGYQYRKKAVLRAEQKEGSLHFCLHDASEVLLWIGGAILSGITWDLLKLGVKKLFAALHDEGRYDSLDKETQEVLSEEKKLYEFYEYVEEYKQGFINISEEEYKYIEEEMFADFQSEEIGKLGPEKYFILSRKEMIEVHKVAYEKSQIKINRIVRRERR
ncbi:MAG: zinc ribbon domain-containing protein [Bacteroidales bacterium]|nr:zinc ribbon domain-containing protein [Bacteroidales bacterium]